MADTKTRAEESGPEGPDVDLPRPLWSVRAVAAVAVLIALALFIVFGLRLLDRHQLTANTHAGPVNRVDIQIARGDIGLELGPDGSTDLAVERTKHWRFSQPSATTEIDPDSGTARIRGSCHRIVILVGTCSVDHVLDVPSGIPIHARTDDGTIRTEGVDGWVRVITSGHPITGTELRATEVLADSDGGDIELDFVAPPSRIEVVSNGGDVTLRLPGGPYTVSINAEVEDSYISVPTERDAERTISIDSGSGAIRILGQP